MGNDRMLMWLEAQDRMQRRKQAQKREKVFHMLAYAGFVQDSGERERNPRTGEMRNVWRLTERGKAEWGAEPSDDEFKECLAECLAEFEAQEIMGR